MQSQEVKPYFDPIPHQKIIKYKDGLKGSFIIYQRYH